MRVKIKREEGGVPALVQLLAFVIRVIRRRWGLPALGPGAASSALRPLSRVRMGNAAAIVVKVLSFMWGARTLQISPENTRENPEHHGNGEGTGGEKSTRCFLRREGVREKQVSREMGRDI